MCHHTKGLATLVLVSMLVAACGASDAAQEPKTAPALFTAEMREKAKSNAAKHPWAKEIQKQIVGAAQPWMKLSDDELWNLMFGPSIKRSWMVWSNGFCPSCKKAVPMYTWEMDALGQPWKVRCPQCKELFPKNDFHKFYLSGLDEHGLFDPAKADRSLLYNTDHPDPKDPLHMFGVDDGEGYVDGKNKWRFIGAYLIYGQWKQAIVQGIKSLAAAYVVTGETAYAHKAGVLLDRVADVYPTFDFKEQGVMYEGSAYAGYVSTWHDACWETQDLAMGYDEVFDAIKDDADLRTFLAGKSKQFKLDNPKASFADIQRNIEDRILRDAIANRPKIQSNYPQTDVTLTFIKTILGWPGNREEVMGLLGDIITRTTAVDGVTGEKGLTGYSALGPRALGFVLARYASVDPGFLRDSLKRYPRIYDCYRFHIDTWCLNGHYYPLIGDCGAFAKSTQSYGGLALLKSSATAVNIPGLPPSMFTFLWDLYKATKDPAFVQVLYRANGGKLDGLPHDLFADDPAALQQSVKKVIDAAGTEVKLRSVNKQEWHLGILRSGSGKNERALWLDYDSGGSHGHMDGMNLGLFAMGLDLLPDFGYPPVQYGGWGSPRSRWYTMTAAHNTVVVDGVNQSAAGGKTTLWADGKAFHAIRASAPDQIKGKQYERTAALVDVSDKSFYVLDVFRVIGGKDHAKFIHSHFGKITTNGLKLVPTADFTQGTQMRSFQVDPAPAPGWNVDWRIDDEYKLLPRGTQPHFRYTDLTTGAQAITAEQWVSKPRFEENGLEDVQFNEVDDAWIPAVIVRRQADQPDLASTFVALMEPYVGNRAVASVTRLPLESPEGVACGDSDVALEIKLADGRTDLFIAADSGARTIAQKARRVKLDGEMCLVRYGKTGKIERIALCNAGSVEVDDAVVKLKSRQSYVEVEFGNSGPVVVAGPRDAVVEIRPGAHK